MTIKQNTFEGGTPATLITAANSGGSSGTAFDFIIGSQADRTQHYSNEVAINGNVVAKIATVTSNVVSFRYTLSATGQAYQRGYYQFSAHPAAARRIMQAFSSGTTRYSVQYLTDGKIRLLNSSGVTVFTTNASPPINAPFRLEVYANLASGQAEMRVYWGADLNSNTPTESFGPTAATFGGTTADTFDVGLTIAAASVPAFYVDGVGVSDETWLGPAPDAEPPDEPPEENIIVTNHPNTSYSDETVEPNNTYQYRVRSRNSSGVSDWSQPITVEVPAVSTSAEVAWVEVEVPSPGEGPPPDPTFAEVAWVEVELPPATVIPPDPTSAEVAWVEVEIPSGITVPQTDLYKDNWGGTPPPTTAELAWAELTLPPPDVVSPGRYIQVRRNGTWESMQIERFQEGNWIPKELEKRESGVWS